jgi:hypothetical protein
MSKRPERTRPSKERHAHECGNKRSSREIHEPSHDFGHLLTDFGGSECIDYLHVILSASDWFCSWRDTAVLFKSSSPFGRKREYKRLQDSLGDAITMIQVEIFQGQQAPRQRPVRRAAAILRSQPMRGPQRVPQRSPELYIPCKVKSRAQLLHRAAHSRPSRSAALLRVRSWRRRARSEAYQSLLTLSCFSLSS